MNKTKISWATHTSNVVSGCHKPPALPPEGYRILQRFMPAVPPAVEKWRAEGTSPECARCYAEVISLRYGFTKQPWQVEHAAVNVQIHPERMKPWAKLPLAEPLAPPSQRPRIFCCSMGDLFHENVPDAFLVDVFQQMRDTPHIYMVLTKRILRASKFTAPWADGGWPPNVWLGTTVGHPITKWRLEYLRRSPAPVRFVSMEPLVASLTDDAADSLFGPLNLTGIHQIIVGGESGSGWRKMNMQWARDLRDRAARTGCAFFFKQDAGPLPGRRPWLVELDGQRNEYHQFPGELTPPRQAAEGDLRVEAGRDALEVLV